MIARNNEIISYSILLLRRLSSSLPPSPSSLFHLLGPSSSSSPFTILSSIPFRKSKNLSAENENEEEVGGKRKEGDRERREREEGWEGGRRRKNGEGAEEGEREAIRGEDGLRKERRREEKKCLDEGGVNNEEEWGGSFLKIIEREVEIRKKKVERLAWNIGEKKTEKESNKELISMNFSLDFCK